METGFWTMRARLAYKKLMLYHNIVKSDEKRVMKKILKVQEKEERSTTWYSNIKKEMKRYRITLDVEEVSKSQWKKHVKERIAEEVEKEVRSICRSKKKGRTVMNDKHERKFYLGKVPLKEMKKILKVRLHMTRIPANFRGGKDGECPLCKHEEGNDEHYFKCKAVERIAEVWEVGEEDINSLDIDKMTRVANFMEKVEMMLEPERKHKKRNKE